MERIHPADREAYYDLFDDWNLIEASFLKQYGIRLRNDDDMSYQEFCSLLSGIMPDTPLGQIVAIRSEKDSKKIKNFTKEQKRIWREWRMNVKKRDKNGISEGNRKLLYLPYFFLSLLKYLNINIKLCMHNICRFTI
jgi:hypothetical protein